METSEKLLSEVRSWIRDCQRPVALTGAGISAESGVPTFRGSGGLWKQYRPEELATPWAFERDPKLVWEWYEWRRGVIAQAKPNAGHYALVKLERTKPHFWLITQNVDGLHERAGSNRLVKLHGDIWQLRCTRCGLTWRDERVPLPELPPRCSCGGLARPGVVWFGEALPSEAWQQAEQAVREADLLLSIGTSAVVYPAAGLIDLALTSNTKVVEINPARTPYTDRVSVFLQGRAGEILPRLIT